MTKKYLYFLRHGESLANAGGQPMPNADIPLTTQGQTQAVRACQNLQRLNITPSHIYHSTLLRAKQTALPFCEHYGILGISLALLDEFNCLAFDNIQHISTQARRQMAQNYWQTASLTHQDGAGADSFAQFLERVDTFIAQLDDFSNHSLFVGHGIWLGLLAYRLMNLPITDNVSMQKFRAMQHAMPMFNTVAYQLTINDGVHQLTWLDLQR